MEIKPKIIVAEISGALILKKEGSDARGYAGTDEGEERFLKDFLTALSLDTTFEIKQKV